MGGGRDGTTRRPLPPKGCSAPAGPLTIMLAAERAEMGKGQVRPSLPRRQAVGGPQLVDRHSAGVDELLPVEALLVGVAGLARLDPPRHVVVVPRRGPR